MTWTLKTKTRCLVCDRELGDNFVERDDVQRNIFGRELPVKLHHSCSQHISTEQLYDFLRPMTEWRRYC